MLLGIECRVLSSVVDEGTKVNIIMEDIVKFDVVAPGKTFLMCEISDLAMLPDKLRVFYKICQYSSIQQCSSCILDLTKCTELQKNGRINRFVKYSSGLLDCVRMCFGVDIYVPMDHMISLFPFYGYNKDKIVKNGVDLINPIEVTQKKLDGHRSLTETSSYDGDIDVLDDDSELLEIIASFQGPNFESNSLSSSDMILDSSVESVNSSFFSRNDISNSMSVDSSIIPNVEGSSTYGAGCQSILPEKQSNDSTDQISRIVQSELVDVASIDSSIPKEFLDKELNRDNMSKYCQTDCDKKKSTTVVKSTKNSSKNLRRGASKLDKYTALPNHRRNISMDTKEESYVRKGNLASTSPSKITSNEISTLSPRMMTTTEPDEASCDNTILSIDPQPIRNDIHEESFVSCFSKVTVVSCEDNSIFPGFRAANYSRIPSASLGWDSTVSVSNTMTKCFDGMEPLDMVFISK